MSAEVIEITGNLIVHRPASIHTSSSEIIFDELRRQPGSAPTRAQLDALDQQVAVGDQLSIEQEVTK